MSTALVTGASGGIGRAIVLELLGRGCDVLATGRDAGRLEATAALAGAASGRLRCVVADLRRAGDHARLVEAVGEGPLGLLVNNAGVAALSAVAELSDAQVDNNLDVNVKVPLRLVRDLHPALTRASPSHIINIASEQVLRPGPGNGLYGASKAAIVFLTRAWAAELAGDGIRVNCLLPGAVETDMLRRAVEPAQVHVPLGRLLQPADVAAWIPRLLDAAVVTGAVVTVDGGTSLHYATGCAVDFSSVVDGEI